MVSKYFNAAKSIVFMLCLLILIHHDPADESKLEGNVVQAIDQIPGLPPWITAFNGVLQFTVSWLVKAAQQNGFFATLSTELDGLLASTTSPAPSAPSSPATPAPAPPAG